VAPLLLAALVTVSVGCPQQTPVDEAEQAKIIDSKLATADGLVKDAKLADAEKMYDAVLGMRADEPRALAGKGRIRLNEKKTDEAIELLQKAAAGAPNDADIHATLARAFAFVDKKTEAVASFATASKLAADDNTLKLEYARALLAAGQAAEAEGLATAVLGDDDTEPGAFTVRGDALFAQDKIEDALADYLRAMKVSRSDKLARAGAAQVFEKQGKYTAAVDEWSEYIKMDCCSDYTNTVAKPKISELQKLEQEQLKKETGL
jgi:superkiller protein 3